ncbi:MAG: GGDEF domain-containing response regulator [Patescibacteria group bacterium]
MELPVVLLVDDGPDFREQAKAEFEAGGHTVEVASNFNEGVNCIHQHEDRLMVAFIDIHLPGLRSGIELLEYIEEIAAHRVVGYAVTGDESIVAHRAALDAGAVRVFIKGRDSIQLMVLYAERSHALRRVRDSSVDQMTGLDNFLTFQRTALAEMKSARGRKDPEVMSLLFIDIDDFKSINDTHGHLIGDKVVREFGRMLREKVRAGGDHPCRFYHGDEFLVLMPNATKEKAENAASKLQKYAEELEVEGKGGRLVPVRISVGIAEMRAHEVKDDLQQSFDELINRADEAMYALKPERARRRRRVR